MATCKECLHYEACVLNEAYWVKHNADQACSVFKDKSKYVEQKHGRWAALDDDCEELEGEEEAMRWGCTACREIVEYSDWTHKSLLTRYCPHCGAKMDGEQ